MFLATHVTLVLSMSTHVTKHDTLLTCDNNTTHTGAHTYVCTYVPMLVYIHVRPSLLYLQLKLNIQYDGKNHQ